MKKILLKVLICSVAVLSATSCMAFGAFDDGGAIVLPPTDVFSEDVPLDAFLVVDMPFEDVNYHWAKEAINYTYLTGLMKGISDKTFSPNKSVTRAMALTVLYRLEGEESVGQEVASGRWFEGAALWAKAEGLISDKEEALQFLKEEISWVELASLLQAYGRNKGLDLTEVMSGDVAEVMSSDENLETSAANEATVTRAELAVLAKKLADLQN